MQNQAISYKGSFHEQLMHRLEESEFISEEDLILEILKKYNYLPDLFMTKFNSIGLFTALFMSLPLNSDQENEIILSILIDLIKKFTNTIDIIKMGPEIDYVLLLVQAQSVNSMKFLSLIIHIDEIYLCALNQVINFITVNYLRFSKIMKDESRLFIINSSTVASKEEDIKDIIIFLYKVLNAQENCFDQAEIIDFLEIIDILTISQTSIPEIVIEEIVRIFTLIYNKFHLFLTENKEARFFSPSICKNFIEGGFNLQFEWKQFYRPEDEKDSKHF